MWQEMQEQYNRGDKGRDRKEIKDIEPAGLSD